MNHFLVRYYDRRFYAGVNVTDVQSKDGMSAKVSQRCRPLTHIECLGRRS